MLLKEEKTNNQSKEKINNKEENKKINIASESSPAIKKEEEFFPIIQQIFIKKKKKEKNVNSKELANVTEENSRNQEKKDDNNPPEKLTYMRLSKPKLDIQKYNTLKELEPFFTEYNKNMEKKGSDLLTEIANDYKDEEFEQDNIIFRYGDQADRFFIIKEGEVLLYFPFTEIIDMNIDEYYIYILRLKRYNEIEMLNNVLLLNHGEFMVEFDEGFNFDEYLIKLYNTYLKLKFDPSFLYKDIIRKKKIKKLENINNIKNKLYIKINNSNNKKGNNNPKEIKYHIFNKGFDNSKFPTFNDRGIKELVLRIGDEIVETMKWSMPEKIYDIYDEVKENQVRRRIINLHPQLLKIYKQYNSNKVNEKEYSQRILPVNKPNNKLTKKKIIIMKYLSLNKLKKGQWFGDFCPDSLSLFSPNYLSIAKRSIISLKMHEFHHFRNMTAISNVPPLIIENNLEASELLEEGKTNEEKENYKDEKKEGKENTNEEKDKTDEEEEKEEEKEEENKEEKEEEEKEATEKENKEEKKITEKEDIDDIEEEEEKEEIQNEDLTNESVNKENNNSNETKSKIQLISFNKRIFFSHFCKFIENITFRKKNYLLNNNLFKNTDNKNLIKTYSICFREKLLKEGEYLIKETDKLKESNTNIYFIIKGEFQANCKKSVSELDEIIKILGHENDIPETFPSLLKDLINTPYYFELIKKPLFLKLNYLNKNDIIGLTEAFINDEYFYNVQCKSNSARVYQVDARIIKLLVDSDPRIFDNKNIILYHKYEMLSDILLKQRKIYFDTFFNAEKYNVQNIVIKNSKDKNNDREMVSDNYTNNIVQNEIANPNLVIIPKINKVLSVINGKIKYGVSKIQSAPNIIRKDKNKSGQKDNSSENIKNFGELDTILANVSGRFTLTDKRKERSLEFRKKYKEKIKQLQEERKIKEEERLKKREMLKNQKQIHIFKKNNNDSSNFYEFKKNYTIVNKMFRELPLLPNKDNYIKSEGEYKFLIPYKKEKLKKSNSACSINPLAYDDFNRNYNTSQYFKFHAKENKIDKYLEGKKDYIIQFKTDIKLIKKKNYFIKKNDILTQKLRNIYNGKYDKVLYNNKKLKKFIE